MYIALIQNVSHLDHRMVYQDNVARELINRGYDVDVIINKSNFNEFMQRTPYTIISLPGETYSIAGQIRFGYSLFRLLQKKTYEILHTKNPFSSILPALFQRSRSKVIYDIRGLWIDFGVYAGYIPQQLAPILNKVDLYCMKEADAVIAISHEMKKILVDRGVKDTKIEVIIGAGVNTEKRIEQQDIKKDLGINGKIIGYVGTISKTRGSHKIIRAFSILRKQTSLDIHLVLMGPISKGEKPYFQKITQTKQLRDSITLTGPLPHEIVLKYLASLDVAIAYHEKDLPIYNVAVPTKILEYLAAGCTIVTTDQKMYLNLLTHEKDAILTAQNPLAFAKGILYVLNNQVIAQRIARNAVQTAAKYSIKKMVDKIEHTYQKISLSRQ